MWLMWVIPYFSDTAKKDWRSVITWSTIQGFPGSRDIKSLPFRPTQGPPKGTSFWTRNENGHINVREIFQIDIFINHPYNLQYKDLPLLFLCKKKNNWFTTPFIQNRNGVRVHPLGSNNPTIQCLQMSPSPLRFPPPEPPSLAARQEPYA